MSGDFDWFGDKDSEKIILTYQPPTAVYHTKDMGIVIRQKADEMEEYDHQVHLTPQGALAVAWALIDQAHLAGLPEPSLSLMVEGPHWPPVTRRKSQEGADSAVEPAQSAKPEPTEPGPLLKVMTAEAAE